MDLDHQDGNSNIGNGNSSSDERDTSDAREGKKQYHRHTPQQIQRLEGFFKECPHPDESQRRQLSSELELEPRQVKFWFQNKRTQTKVQNERADNNSLKMENEKMQCENLAIREALKNVKCLDCMGSFFGEEEGIPNIQRLRMENVQLKQEYERLSSMVANFLGKPVEQIKSLSSSSSSSLDTRRETLGLFPAGGGDGGGGGHQMTPELGLSLDLGIGTTPSSSPSNSIFQNQLINMTTRDVEKPVMIETAVNAMAELYKLLQINEPLWTRSPADGRLVLHRESYRKLFSRPSHFSSSNARFESSKHSGLVGMSALQLLDKLLDPNKWVDLFPTIITKARTIEVLDTRIILGEQAGLLQLMYEQMHILSPLVAPREYYFLRYCRDVGSGVWMMVDVSYDQFREQHLNASPLRSWKLPSGCMVQDISNGCCEVTWVEHVEVDDRSQTHRLYRELVCGFAAYGAERWIVTLQRMSQRLACSAGANSPIHALRGVIPTPEGMKSIMDLSHRMVKDFWGMLSMSGRLDFPHISEVDNSGVRVAIRKSNQPGHPTGAVVCAAASLWLPLSPTALFNFFSDEKNRVQWDVLANGHSVDEIANIPCGSHTGNCISILKPIIPKERNMLVLQESWLDPLGSVLVYAPIDLPAIKSAMSGQNNINTPVLPSGLIISGDGSSDQVGSNRASTSTSSSRRSGGGGSLLTVAFQILVTRQTSMDTVATANGLVSSTVQRIKAALDCSDDHVD